MGYSNCNLEPILIFIWEYMVIKGYVDVGDGFRRRTLLLQPVAFPVKKTVFHRDSPLYGVLSWVTKVWIQDSLMWKYKFVLVETGMVRTVRYILLIRSFFVRLYKIESLRIRFRLWNWIEGPKELFLRFCWFQTNSNRTLFKEGSSRDYTDQWNN